MRPVVGVIGDARMPKTTEKWKAARLLGLRLIDADYRIITGGLGDLPKALAEGARKSRRYRDGDLIALLPGFDPSAAGRHCDIAIATGIDHGRNAIVANSDAVIAIGGGAGTLSEMAFAWSLKRLILAYRVDGWSGKLAATQIDSRSRYRELDDQVYPVDTAEEVIRALGSLLPKYNRRHNGTTVRRRRS